MKRLIFAAAFAALLGISTGANAWWGGPFGGWGPWNNGWGNDWFGEGGFDFSLSFGGWGRGWGNNGWDYYNPYWDYPYGYYPYGLYPYAAPYWSYPYAVQPYAVQPITPAAPASKAAK